MAASLAVMADSTAGSGLGHYVFATVLMAAAMGFAMAPATDSIMGALPAARPASAPPSTTPPARSAASWASPCSAASPAPPTCTRSPTPCLLCPTPPADTARSSVGGALTVAQRIGGPTGNHVADAAREAFVHGASKGLLVAIIAAGLGALLALRYLRARNAEAERAP
jgi:hypothetical protein